MYFHSSEIPARFKIAVEPPATPQSFHIEKDTDVSSLEFDQPHYNAVFLVYYSDELLTPPNHTLKDVHKDLVSRLCSLNRHNIVIANFSELSSSHVVKCNPLEIFEDAVKRQLRSKYW